MDRQRRSSRARARERASGAVGARPADPVLAEMLATQEVPDERLRLVFACCHPAVARADAVALTLRTVAGLRTEELAACFVVSVPTMQARITRAKARIRDAGVPFRVPEDHELPDRLPPVLDVVALVHARGYTPVGDVATVPTLRREALRLATVLADHFPDEPEVTGLRALLLLHEARSATRVAPDGSLRTLEEMDRGRWDRDMIDEGERLLERSLRRGRPGPYQLQAAISAVHSLAPSHDATDWRQIVALYDQLLAMAPSPTTAVARAIAVGMASGPAAGLDALPPAAPPMTGFHRWHAARGDLLHRAGRPDEAAASFEHASVLARNAAERRWLEERARACADEDRGQGASGAAG